MLVRRMGKRLGADLREDVIDHLDVLESLDIAGQEALHDNNELSARFHELIPTGRLHVEVTLLQRPANKYPT